MFFNLNMCISGIFPPAFIRHFKFYFFGSVCPSFFPTGFSVEVICSCIESRSQPDVMLCLGKIPVQHGVMQLLTNAFFLKFRI